MPPETADSVNSVIDEVERPGDEDVALAKFVAASSNAAMSQHIRTGDLMRAADYEARDLAEFGKQLRHLRRRLRKFLA